MTQSTPYATIDGGTIGTGPDTLVLAMAEDAYKGDAMFNVAIDGKTLNLQALSVTALRTAGQVELFTFKGSFGTGAHDVGVSFLNDAYDGTPQTDRNLFLNGASYDGLQTRPSTVAFMSAGTAHLTVPPAGDPEASPAVVNGGTSGIGPDTLVLTLSEDSYKGDAAFNVAIDGKTLNLQPLSVTALRTAGQTETFTFKGTFGSGAHDLGVSFLNDAYGGTALTDRNLYVNGATFNGITTRPPMAALLSTGTQHFTIPPAADPEASGGSAGASATASAMHLMMPTPGQG